MKIYANSLFCQVFSNKNTKAPDGIIVDKHQGLQRTKIYFLTSSSNNLMIFSNRAVMAIGTNMIQMSKNTLIPKQRISALTLPPLEAKGHIYSSFF
jgi:hypothetical protein